MQYSVMIYMGKESEKVDIWMCIIKSLCCMRKLIQHCESTIYQYKIKKIKKYTYIAYLILRIISFQALNHSSLPLKQLSQLGWQEEWGWKVFLSFQASS